MKNAAQVINRLHANLVKISTKTAIKIGDLLTQQKEKVGHGNWEKWMEEYLDFSATTAKRYMSLFEYYDELPQEETTKLVGMALSEAYKKVSNTRDRNDYLQEQDEERNRRREAFANRKHIYQHQPKKGDYLNQVVCGDCTVVGEEMINNGMENKVDLVIFSPPYNNKREYGNGYNDSKDYKDYLVMLQKIIGISYKLLKRGGKLFINIDEMSRKSKTGDKHFSLEADIIYMIREMNIELYEYEKIVWFKKNSGSDWQNCVGSTFKPSSPNLKSKYEKILVFCKKDRALPNPGNVKADIENKEFLEWTTNHWDIHPINHMTPHPASYPMQLTDRIIKLFSWPGSETVIFDPFCGSGTTLKSAQKLGRSWIGTDQNPNYAQYSRDRLDLTEQELKTKYAEFLGGKRSDKKKTATSKTVSFSKLKKNTSFEKRQKNAKKTPNVKKSA